MRHRNAMVGVICAVVTVVGMAFVTTGTSTNDEPRRAFSLNADEPWHVERPRDLELPGIVASPTPIVGPITEDQAREIGQRTATLRADSEASLTTIRQVSLGDVIRERSPGSDIYGWPLGMQVFELHYTGGPFDLVRSRPIRRPETDPAFTSMYIVISVNDGQVISVGSLCKPP